MAENIATVIHWYGPYKTLEIARKEAKEEFVDGLYAAIGYRLGALRKRRQLLYIGVGTPLKSRLIRQHKKIGKPKEASPGGTHHAPVGEIVEFWLGEIASPKVPGKRLKKIEPHLDMVEWMTAFFLKVFGNQQKRGAPPPLSGVMLNRWYSAEDYDLSMPRPVVRWADVIEFDSFANTANLVWFGRKAKVMNVADVEKLRQARKRAATSPIEDDAA